MAERHSTPGVIYGAIPNHPIWTTQEMVDIFARLLINGWLDGEMTPSMAVVWGKRLAHYGLLALAERDQPHPVVTELVEATRTLYGLPAQAEKGGA